FQCCSKRRNEVVRQLSYKTDRIRDEHLRLADIDLARERIERGKEAVLYEHILAAREGSKDGRFARVGVAHERGLELLLARLPLHDTTLLHVAQPLLEELDPLVDETPVGLQLGLTRT